MLPDVAHDLSGLPEMRVEAAAGMEGKRAVGRHAQQQLVVVAMEAMLECAGRPVSAADSIDS
jgi:hypothetical protein